MTKQDEYGPENPRDWNPNAPELTSGKAPHETAAVLRMHRAGKKGVEIMKELGHRRPMKGTVFMEELSDAMTAEYDAAQAGVDIYDARVKPGTE